VLQYTFVDVTKNKKCWQAFRPLGSKPEWAGGMQIVTKNGATSRNKVTSSPQLFGATKRLPSLTTALLRSAQAAGLEA
jgi:hypothetical protein